LDSRSKLEDTLQNLSEHPERTKEPIKLRLEQRLHGKEVQRGGGSMFDSPARKRRHHDSDDFLRDPVVMKIFERNVDFGAFAADAPLYGMARAWIRNEAAWGPASNPANWNDLPKGAKLSAGYQEEAAAAIGAGAGGATGSGSGADGLYELPGPCDERSDAEVRVPAVERPAEEPLDIHCDPGLAPVPEQLLINHLDWWKTVKQVHLGAMKDNLNRYAEADDILKSMSNKTFVNPTAFM